MEKIMPLYVTVLRWGAIAVIVVGEVILVAGPLLMTPLGWLTRQSADWWGAAGQWAGALGSFAAVVVALMIARRGARDAARIAEQSARDVEARSRRRQRARATLVRGEFYNVGGIEQVEVINDSPSPVIEVQVKDVKGLQVLPVIPPSGRWPVWPVIAPGERFLVKPEFGFAQFGADVMGVFRATSIVVVEFTDVEGYRWRREGNEMPQLID